MSKDKKTPQDPVEETPVETPEETAQRDAETTDPVLEELASLKDELVEKEDKYLRLLAEYDNFRKRSQKEKEGIYTDAKADALTAFLPVYDNLERALKSPCSDEAYVKGVEMTMAGLKEILSKLGIEEIPALGASFDANLHNAVMHVEDDSVEESTIVEVFQTGFKLGEKVIRFAMVKVAN